MLKHLTQNQPNDDPKIRMLLKNIDENLDSLQAVWITRNTSKTFGYLLKITSLFLTYGYGILKENPSALDILCCSFLYSLPIDKKKIRCPRNLTNEQKQQYGKNMDVLIESWSTLKTIFHYETICCEAFDTEEDKTQLQIKLKNLISFE